MVTFRGDDNAPWFADFANYYAGNFVIKGMSFSAEEEFFKRSNTILGRPYLFKICAASSDRRVLVGKVVPLGRTNRLTHGQDISKESQKRQTKHGMEKSKSSQSLKSTT
ncbi:hypothetical protein Tco_0774965 [Tanacetum coccineum]|uniref:Reverse transcriptase domain-containing protein n=1 Tax=Tanacetum coccineum TaxID=301880 RepID=A0ABQ4ZPZ9_9ASTR